jgi:hypothetical protein
VAGHDLYLAEIGVGGRGEGDAGDAYDLSVGDCDAGAAPAGAVYIGAWCRQVDRDEVPGLDRTDP